MTTKGPLVVPLDNHTVEVAVEGDTEQATAILHATVCEIRLEGSRTSLFNLSADLMRILGNLSPPPQPASDEYIARHLSPESGIGS